MKFAPAIRRKRAGHILGRFTEARAKTCGRPARLGRQARPITGIAVLASLLVACGAGQDSATEESSAAESSSAESALDPTVQQYPPFTGSRTEYWAAFESCMEEFGYAMSTNGYGTLTYDAFPPDFTEEQHQLNRESCHHTVGMPDPSRFTEEQILASYERRVTAHECLVEAGFAQGDPATLETFRHSLTTLEPWDPQQTALATYTTPREHHLINLCSGDSDAW